MAYLKGYGVMKFKSEEELKMFLQDKPFYKDNESFCLGDTMAEAGAIISEIIEETERKTYERKEYMGMDNKKA